MITLKDLAGQRKLVKQAGLLSFIRRGLRRAQETLPSRGKLEVALNLTPHTISDAKGITRFVYRPALQSRFALEGVTRPLETLIEKPYIAPIIGASVGSALLAGGELASYLHAKARKDSVFEEIVSQDEYLSENRDDAKRMFDVLYKVAPRTMSNVHLARQVLRQTVSMGTIPPDVVSQLQRLEAHESPAHRMLGHISNVKLPS